MKTAIAITLIIVGALLIMTPVLSDHLHESNVVALLSRDSIKQVTLTGQMSEMYRFGCWLTGSAMIGVAVLAGLATRRAEQANVARHTA
jgi:hypothetical protein